jgi:hypothetical protein
VLRVEATCHNAAELGCGSVLGRLPDIIGRLGEMAGRFCTTLDCASVGSLTDGFLDELPRPATLGATRVGGIDLGSLRARRAMAAIAALSAAPKGFSVADLVAKVQRLSGQGTDSYSARQAAYDLRKFRAKHLVDKPGRARRYHVTPEALSTITAVTIIRDKVLAPLLGEVRKPRRVVTRKNWTPIEHDYEKLRSGMEDLFGHLGILTAA